MRIPDIIMLPPNRVWRTYPGGRTLDEREGKPHPEDTHFPEDWIASTTRAVNKGREHLQPEGLTRVELDGETHFLNALMEAFPREILGETHFEKYGANTQFLLKLLDSATRLHVQAHPTIPFARQHLNSDSGKTEAYVILAIRDEVPEPYVYLGFQVPLSRNEFRSAVLAQDSEKILSCFEKIPVRPGDVFVVPGGLPHAIGEGIFMIEIMEPTDFTVRFEFERGGYVLPEEARFMGRDVDFALDMIDFETRSTIEIKQRLFCKPRVVDEQSGGVREVLIDSEKTPFFSVNRLKITDGFHRSANAFCVGIVTRGQGLVRAGESDVALRLGDKFLVPYQTHEIECLTQKELEIVLTVPPA